MEEKIGRTDRPTVVRIDLSRSAKSMFPEGTHDDAFREPRIHSE